ncbi:MAG: nicotinamide-nucleotide amidohydrolase family protein [Chloroflexi bacterium]|nr:nicotinamide-nucleotide amidohydrolase family protein [Chloroflexota bacterium]
MEVDKIKAYVRSFYDPSDEVHGWPHVERVLRWALALAEAEGADPDIVQAAVLFHDLPARGKATTARDAHHYAAAEHARTWLLEHGWPPERAAAVAEAILSHRFREAKAPHTREAQVVHDADKLDAIGAIGAARAIGYAVQHGQPFYARPRERFESSGQRMADEPHSAYHEYRFKLRHLPERMTTPTARAWARVLAERTTGFFRNLRDEAELGPSSPELNEPAPEARVGPLLLARGWTLAVAESCTAGLLGYRVTRIPGSSAYFVGGVIAYANEVKIHVLGVPESILMAHGAVSEPTVRYMAQGVRQVTGADVALSISGIAGPGGGTPLKPVGTVWFGLATPTGVAARRVHFPYDREGNRQAAATFALRWLVETLQQD